MIERPSSAQSDLDIDYQRRADQHKPTDESLLRVAVHELAARGLTPRDIGAALGLDPTAVRRLLGVEAEAHP